MKRAGIILGFVALTGCSTSLPDFQGEPIEIFAIAPDAPEAWAASGVSQAAPNGDWLSQFNDAQMVALVEEALAANPSVRAQFYAVEAAKASARGVIGRSRPNVSLSASGGATSNFFETPAGDDRATDTTFGLGADFNWEYDLWGRIGAAIDAAETDLAASEADLAAARLAIAAQTAIAWIDLNEALAQERVAVQTYEARVRIQELTERRIARGLASALDVRTSRTSVAVSEAAIAARRLASSNAVRRLEILLGRYPANLIDAPATFAELEPLQPAGSPLMLLTRRPDIAASELRVISAGLRAEQARLAMLPSLRFTGSLSTTETDIVDALNPTRIAARLIASLTAPLINGGALEADRDAAIAQAKGAVENYASTVLTAWREVEDAISADTLLAQQENAQFRALEEALLAEEIATRQYTNGLISIFELINAQTSRLNAESNVIAARSARASNRVAYHLALGGGLPVEAPSPEPDTQNNPPEEGLLP